MNWVSFFPPLISVTFKCLFPCIALVCKSTHEPDFELIPTVQVNPYEEFLLKQCKKMVQENRMIAVCQSLPMSAEMRKAAKNKLMKKGMNLRFFSNSLMRSVKGCNSYTILLFIILISSSILSSSIILIGVFISIFPNQLKVPQG